MFFLLLLEMIEGMQNINFSERDKEVEKNLPVFLL